MESLQHDVEIFCGQNAFMFLCVEFFTNSYALCLTCSYDDVILLCMKSCVCEVTAKQD